MFTYLNLLPICRAIWLSFCQAEALHAKARPFRQCYQHFFKPSFQSIKAEWLMPPASAFDISVYTQHVHKWLLLC
jgi:hypothetical protein